MFRGCFVALIQLHVSPPKSYLAASTWRGVALGGMGEVRWEYSPGRATLGKKAIPICSANAWRKVRFLLSGAQGTWYQLKLFILLLTILSLTNSGPCAILVFFN
ncbi:hypothetical protein AVEN_134780-1 [Araneus ventricosus]|uniref:Uncharacterized protein n=1 Tax=Araneus ventricosus TaxID=182803 RepID=A0A4Y2GAJ2_ARAVE|nr:hypothetical protein AVEN_134780-1 [Araneus ventricosus]